MFLVIMVVMAYVPYRFRHNIPFYPMMQADVQELKSSQDEQLISIYKLVESINNRMYMQTNNYMTLTHYISGHDFRHPTNHCPECGLLQALNKREKELDDTINSLVIKNQELEDNDKRGSLDWSQNTDALTKLTAERVLVKQHLYNMDERAKAVNKIMRDHKLEGN